MAANYPNTLPAIPTIIGGPTGDTTTTTGKEHSVVHNQLAEELTAIAMRLGVDGNTSPATIIGLLAQKLSATVTSPAVDHVIKWDGTKFINGSAPAGAGTGGLDWIKPAGSTLTDFHNARNTAGVGGTVYVPKGSYTFSSPLQLSTPGQNWIIHPGAFFTVANAADCSVMNISGDGVVVAGGKWDGNGANIGTGQAVINITGHRSGIRNAEVTNGDSSGVRVAGCNFAFVEGCYVHRNATFDILVDVSGAAGSNYTRIENNTVVNTGTQAGIHARGDNVGTVLSRGTRIASNHVTRYSPGTFTHDHAEIGIEVWGYAPFCTIVNNHVVGAWMCVSVDKADHTTVAGNTGDNCKWGYELAGSSHCTVTGNTIDCRYIANSIGVSCSNAGNGINTISSNNIYRAATGIHLNGSEGNGSEKYVVIGNTVDGIDGSGKGVYCQMARSVVIASNQFLGTGAAGSRAILLENSSDLAISGNLLRSMSQFIHMYAFSNFTFDDITVTGNHLDGAAGIVESANTGAVLSLGPAIRLANNVGFAAYLDYAAKLRQTFGTGTPEGFVSAGVGSTYQRRDGGAGTCLYLKQSGGTGNTGWVAQA